MKMLRRKYLIFLRIENYRKTGRLNSARLRQKTKREYNNIKNSVHSTRQCHFSHFKPLQPLQATKTISDAHIIVSKQTVQPSERNDDSHFIVSSQCVQLSDSHIIVP